MKANRYSATCATVDIILTLANEAKEIVYNEYKP